MKATITDATRNPKKIKRTMDKCYELAKRVAELRQARYEKLKRELEHND